MKKASFILSLIGGIIGILGSGVLLLVGLGMLVTNPNTSTVISSSVLSLLLNIGALVSGCINGKKVVNGIIIIVSGLANIMVINGSVLADSPLTFIVGLVVVILLLVAGILRLCVKECNE